MLWANNIIFNQSRNTEDFAKLGAPLNQISIVAKLQYNYKYLSVCLSVSNV